MPAYRGRFAPTPSGPLHFGSLVAALGSYLEARTRAGAWLVRIEDVDPPRVVAGAEDAILATLEAFGFEWDGPVMRQSRRAEAYRAALAALRRDGRVYGCACSRKQLAEAARRGVDGPVYPGTCRAGHAHDPALAQRFRVPDGRIAFDDGLLGRVACDVARECGDFVLRRADGVYTYQLAVVVDDAEQGISHVVRGADLLTSTPRQIVLQQVLGLATPAYLHLPVVLDGHGDKLSKQTLARPVAAAQPLPALLAAAAFLGLVLPPGLGSVAEFWPVAAGAWPARVLAPVRGRRTNLCKP
ncbi:tRNA glutamyl-Q(34) synthetase GluQRS [Parasulfuritortus cantonensis]|uniref:tRNA glutamyl-Q(34) synthetase GluQRS n=1 Tax=Parasulfuritortus cantonensis TaxID=2528202 RepID=UPI001F0F21A2|nr:tRNA glutamyl-Q(34) synthetase GluQRS [Parasulfuritortus cantonensis]